MRRIVWLENTDFLDGRVSVNEEGKTVDAEPGLAGSPGGS
jgi:hypothetical protein